MGLSRVRDSTKFVRRWHCSFLSDFHFLDPNFCDTSINSWIPFGEQSRNLFARLFPIPLSAILSLCYSERTRMLDHHALARLADTGLLGNSDFSPSLACARIVGPISRKLQYLEYFNARRFPIVLRNYSGEAVSDAFTEQTQHGFSLFSHWVWQ